MHRKTLFLLMLLIAQAACLAAGLVVHTRQQMVLARTIRAGAESTQDAVLLGVNIFVWTFGLQAAVAWVLIGKLFGRHQVEAHVLGDPVRGEMAPRRVAHGFIVAQDLDAFVSMEDAHDLRVHPGNRREFAWPIGFVVRPRNPRRLVCLPLRRPTPHTTGTLITKALRCAEIP